MLKESLRMVKGIIKEKMQERKENNILRQIQTQYVQDIVAGKFPELIVTNEKVAEAIVKWCGEEKNPVEFFLKHLSIMGVQKPVTIENAAEGKEYYFLKMKENNKETIWEFNISKHPKDFLIRERVFEERVYYSVREIYYSTFNTENLVGTSLEVKKDGVDFKYSRKGIIEISIGKEIVIKLHGIDWKINENLYQQAKKLIAEINSLDKSLEPYPYYVEAKKIIASYYNLENVEITLTMKHFYMITQDGKLVGYKDAIKGITIKNYNKWSCKEYFTGKEKVVFENDKIKIEGITSSKIQEFVNTAEKAIQEIEKLQY